MRCERAQEALSALRYDGQPLDEATRRHVAECDECSRFERDGQALDGLLSLDAAPGAPLGFDTRFFARLEEERAQHQQRGLRRWAFAMLPIAAGAALALLHVPPTTTPQVQPAGEELGLMMDLELIEEIEVVERLDELEAFDLLGDVEMEALEHALEDEP